MDQYLSRRIQISAIFLYGSLHPTTIDYLEYLELVGVINYLYALCRLIMYYFTAELIEQM